jgi:hypothetical protein
VPLIVSPFDGGVTTGGDGAELLHASISSGATTHAGTRIA